MHLPAWLHGLPANVIGSLIATGIIAALIALWPAMKWPWYEAVGVFVGAFLFIVAAVGQLEDFIGRIRRRARNTAAPAQIGAEIRNWLSLLQFGPQDVSEANFNFVFLCRDFYQHPFHVFQARIAPKMIGVSTWIEWNEQQWRVLDRNAALLAALRIEMARMGIVYTVNAPAKRMVARMDLPWGEFLTDYILRLGIDHVFRARAILNEMALLELAKEQVQIEVVAQPQLPEPKEQPKPEKT